MARDHKAGPIRSPPPPPPCAPISRFGRARMGRGEQSKGKWDVFIGHSRRCAPAVVLAEALNNYLTYELGLTVWLVSVICSEG